MIVSCTGSNMNGTILIFISTAGMVCGGLMDQVPDLVFCRGLGLSCVVPCFWCSMSFRLPWSDGNGIWKAKGPAHAPPGLPAYLYLCLSISISITITRLLTVWPVCWRFLPVFSLSANGWELLQGDNSKGLFPQPSILIFRGEEKWCLRCLVLSSFCFWLEIAELWKQS